jgi:glycerophosphoryl diester phosphodiesterase
MGHAPENTIASIVKALELGASCVEIDVYYVDGQLMVFHDDRLERTTNGTGLIMEQTFQDLRRLDAGQGEKIPTLEEVFEAVNRRAGVNIELKGPGTAEPVAAFLKLGWQSDLVLISSFDHSELAHVRKLDSHVKIGALIEDLPLDNALLASDLGLYSAHLSIQSIDSVFVEAAHARGLQVFVFTVNHTEDIARMQRLGVDGVFTDYPDRVLAYNKGKANAIGWR